MSDPDSDEWQKTLDNLVKTLKFDAKYQKSQREKRKLKKEEDAISGITAIPLTEEREKNNAYQREMYKKRKYNKEHNIVKSPKIKIKIKLTQPEIDKNKAYQHTKYMERKSKKINNSVQNNTLLDVGGFRKRKTKKLKN